MSRLLLKRDETSVNAPSADQLQVGELVLNSVTGKLYTKLSNGDIMEYIGQKVCYSILPSIKYFYEDKEVSDSIQGFCCAGGIFVAEVSGLRLSPVNYTFALVELTTNTSPQNITVGAPEYSVYAVSGINYRKALIPITLSINSSSYKNISIFKLNVFSEGIKISEHIITLQCLEAGV